MRTRKDTHNKRHFIVLKVLFFFQIRCVRKKSNIIVILSKDMNQFDDHVTLDLTF